MPLHLELGSGYGHSYLGKAIVVDSKGRHYSKEPIPMEKAKAQMRVIEAAKKKKASM